MSIAHNFFNYFGRKAVRLKWKIGPVRSVKPLDRSDEMLVLLDTQKIDLSIQPVDAAGNPAKVDGKPQWQVVGTNPEILDLKVSDDGLAATAITKGPLGTAQILVSADADLGEGQKPLTGILDIEVQGAEAVALNVAAGSPVDK